MYKGWFVVCISFATFIFGTSFGVGWSHYGRGLTATAADSKEVSRLEDAFRFETPKVFPNGFKLQVEHPLNTDFLTYHVSTRVTARTFEDIGTLISDTDSPNGALLRDLHEVNGVGKVILAPYEVIIEKGQVFDWHDMLPELETVIRRHLEPRVSAQK